MKIEQAISFACDMHRGQTDKSGEPYILHPLRVMHAVWRAGGDHEMMIVAVLHDVLEDGRCVPARFADVWTVLSTPVRAAMDAITRRLGEPYAHYVRRCAENEVARHVKLLDIADNSAPWRMGRLPIEQQASLSKRYEAARRVLEKRA